MKRTLINAVGALVLGLLGVLAFDSLRPVSTILRPQLALALFGPSGGEPPGVVLVQIRRHFLRGGLLGWIAPLPPRPFLKWVRVDPETGDLAEERFLTQSLEFGPGAAMPLLAGGELFAQTAPTPATRATLFRWDGVEFMRVPPGEHAPVRARLAKDAAVTAADAAAAITRESGGAWAMATAPAFDLSRPEATMEPVEVPVGAAGWALRLERVDDRYRVALVHPRLGRTELYEIEAQVSAVDARELAVQLAEPMKQGDPR